MQTAAHSNHSYIQLQTLQEQHKYFERERKKRKKERKEKKRKKKIPSSYASVIQTT